MLMIKFFFLLLIRYTMSTTSIRTFPTINLEENVPINTNVINLRRKEEGRVNEMKLILLNLGGFETDLFEVRQENILTKNEIDREQFVVEKRCFDRSYCLIELHILVNDGEEYWVIPIHIVDVNDNKPQFKNSSITMKFLLNNYNEYKIPFEGAIDYDEGINNKIFYILDCSKEKSEEIKIFNLNETTLNCFPIFDLIIFSQSLINQNDQLGIKLNPTSLLLNNYQLILFSFNQNSNGKKELINQMKINVQIEKILEIPKFISSEYQFLIKDEFILKNKGKIGQVFAKSNDQREKIVYRILNETNHFKINEKSGEIFILNDQITENEICLIIEGFYLSNSKIKSSIVVEILIRLLNRLNENVLFDYQINSPFIKQINYSNQFEIIKNKENISSNEILFQFLIKSFDYPKDQFDLFLLNNYFFFSLSKQFNNYYLLKLHNSSLFIQLEEINLIIQIKHQLTNQYLTNRTITFFNNQSSSSSSLLSNGIISPSTICLANEIYFISDINQKKLIGKMEVIKTNLNILSFSTFWKSEENEIIVDQCRMKIMKNENLNESIYQICSVDKKCFQISMKKSKSEKIFKFRSIEITIISFSFIFILSSITLIIIICYLRGFHFCLSIKNYLFYGKKYGIHHSQQISKKNNGRIDSIVVRESQSSVIKHFEPYIFTINQLIEEEETIPSINLYSSDSSHSQLPQSVLSSLERTNNDKNSPLSVGKETKQLLEILRSNEDFDLSRLASEV